MATEAAPCQATGPSPEVAIAAPERGHALGGGGRRHWSRSHHRTFVAKAATPQQILLAPSGHPSARAMRPARSRGRGTAILAVSRWGARTCRTWPAPSRRRRPGKRKTPGSFRLRGS